MGSPIAQTSTSLLQTKVRMDWKEIAWRSVAVVIPCAIIAGSFTDPVLTLKVLGVILGLVLLGVLGYALIHWCIIGPLQQQQRQLNDYNNKKNTYNINNFVRLS